MRLTRRSFLGSTAATLLPFAAPAVPLGADGFRLLNAGKTTLALLPQPGPKTPAFAFGGSVPGPLLRYPKGEEIKIRLANGLDAPLTFSCQGMRIANAMDGVAGLTQAPVAPGQSFDYRFTPPDSGFYWYRSGVPGLLEEQLGDGLYGPLLVEEEKPPAVDRDITVVLADWSLDAAGHISPGGRETNGHYAISVNGAAAPETLELAPGARLRLRLLSLIRTQLVFLYFAGLKPLVVAIDGQPCDAFEPLRQTIPIGPGATFDVLCDLPPEAGAKASVAWRAGAPADRPLLVFTTRGTPRPVLPNSGPLPPNPLLPTRIALEKAYRADLVLESLPQAPPGSKSPPGPKAPGFTLNGKPATNFAAAPLFAVKRGTPVTLALANKTALLAQIHVHGHALRLLHDLDDGWEPYWRTCVIVPERRSKHVAFVADNPGKWAIDIQTLDAEPAWLFGWFEVI